MMEPGKEYYKERNFTPCPNPPKKLSKEREPPPRIKTSHKALSGLGIPRWGKGGKLGLKKRLAIANWYKARLI